MENNVEIDMSDENMKFCVSWVAMRVMNTAIQAFVQAWNYHRPEGGVPNTLSAQNNHVAPLPSYVLPSTQEMVQIHERDGLRLQRDASYGTDPLNGFSN